MSGSEGNDFDPRFDPAFQPGFDPGQHPTGRRTPRPAAPEPVAPALLPEPIAVPDLDETTPAPADEPVASGRPEPLLVTLWIVSAVFVAAGIYGLRLIGDRVSSLTSSGGFGGADYYLLQAYTFGAPMLIVLGLATATGTLFLLAARRLRAR
ncbi:MAG: hypothetical protein JWN36_302 [Microbacteriaceae bacterium]|nr:hypothetical protein [Microbacteriaceae bacterium]